MSVAFPHPAATWILQVHPHFRHYKTAGDGDCFFSSFQMILQSLNHPQTTEQLRKIVAQSVLNADDVACNNTIQHWLEVYTGAWKEKNMMLLREYQYMYCIPPDTTWPLSAAHRQQLYESLCTSRYWADHHALRMIEETFRVRFVVLNEESQLPTLTWYHSHDYKPIFYCFLYLNGQHYEPLSLGDRFVWKWEEIPVPVQLFITKAYKTQKRSTA